MRVFVTFKKERGARFISHLDTLRTVQRALRRAQIPVKYSGGYNPHPVLSFASALSVGMTSQGELFDVALAQEMDEGALFKALAPHMPPAMPLVEAHAVPDDYPSAMAAMAAADYHLTLRIFGSYDKAKLPSRIQKLKDEPMPSEKKSKAGVKQIDLRDMIIGDIHVALDAALDCLQIDVRCANTNAGALNPQLLLPYLCRDLDQVECSIERRALWGQKNQEYVALWDLR